MADTQSPKGKLNGADMKSWFMTAVLAAISILFTTLAENIGNLGLSPELATMLAGGILMILKLIQKILSGPTNPPVVS